MCVFIHLSNSLLKKYSFIQSETKVDLRSKIPISNEKDMLLLTLLF